MAANVLFVPFIPLGFSICSQFSQMVSFICINLFCSQQSLLCFLYFVPTDSNVCFQTQSSHLPTKIQRMSRIFCNNSYWWQLQIYGFMHCSFYGQNLTSKEKRIILLQFRNLKKENIYQILEEICFQRKFHHIILTQLKNFWGSILAKFLQFFQFKKNWC